MSFSISAIACASRKIFLLIINIPVLPLVLLCGFPVLRPTPNLYPLPSPTLKLNNGVSSPLSPHIILALQAATALASFSQATNHGLSGICGLSQGDWTTHICRPSQIANGRGYDSNVDECDPGCSWCPPEVLPSVGGHVWMKGISRYA